jgi:hypothetical protein
VSVFKETMGIPLHPLMVHAAVVFVPLLALAAYVYAFVPTLRGRVGWAAAVLAVAGPVTALFAKESGEALQEVLVRKNYPPEILDKVAQHQDYGNLTFWFSLGLGVVTALLVFATRENPWARDLPAWVRFGLTAAVAVFGALSAVYTYLTGESGAQAVWTGVL